MTDSAVFAAVPLCCDSDVYTFKFNVLQLILDIYSPYFKNSLESKTLFIVPTDAHYYKIIEMLKQFKIITIVPTCFGSHSNHHQGAIMCLAKTTNTFFCTRRYRCSQCYGGISACCASV